MSGTKRKLRATVNVHNGNKATVEYQGRILGLVDDKEFNTLLKDRKLQNKCNTRRTMSLKEITDSHIDLEGLRLVVAVKKIDKVSALPTLFVSERLHYVSYVQPSGDCGFTGESHSYIMAEEKEV